MLPTLIDRAQSAFIPGRSISDNILLSQELLRNYHSADTPPRGAIKVDLKKAYDTVRWEFLLDLLEGLHFPHSMIRWIKACISTPKFSLNINGSLEGFFRSSRGIRQGDPISPYLFVLHYQWSSISWSPPPVSLLTIRDVTKRKSLIYVLRMTWLFFVVGIRIRWLSLSKPWMFSSLCRGYLPTILRAPFLLPVLMSPSNLPFRASLALLLVLFLPDTWGFRLSPRDYLLWTAKIWWRG